MQIDKILSSKSQTVVPLSLINGGYYYISNLSHKNLYLTYSKGIQSEQQKYNLKFQQLSSSSLQQIWMIQQKQNQKYQIVHAFTSMVFQDIGHQIQLRIDKLKNSQLFNIKKCQDQHKKYVIKINQNNNSSKFIYYEDQKLKYQQKPIYKDDSNKWTLQLITKHSLIDNTFIIQSMLSNQVISIQNSSLKLQQPVVQSLLNKRFNQRFYIQKDQDKQYFIIKSLSSNLVLDIEGQRRKQGTNIIQYQYKNTLNQKWILQQHGKMLFLIKSAMDKSLMITVKASSLKDHIQLVITKNQSEAFWKIYGNLLLIEN